MNMVGKFKNLYKIKFVHITYIYSYIYIYNLLTETN